MVELDWCKAQNRGIKLIEPNDNLCNEYLQTAQETLDVLQSVQSKSKVWLATTKYYCEYFSIYALLMKLGIKSEIHSCTIALTKKMEEMDILPSGTSVTLEEDKQLRIDNQYYLKNRDVPFDYDEMVQFVLFIKNLISELTADEIKTTREKLF